MQPGVAINISVVKSLSVKKNCATQKISINVSMFISATISAQ